MTAPMARQARTDWGAVRHAWETRGHRTVEQIAARFGVRPDTVRYHAAKERWARPLRNLRLTGKAVPKGTVRARCHACGALYDATLTLDGASAHCAEVPA